ncbi:DUF5916 domain-containing protein [Flavobacterium sp. ZB4R12]|uniref:carbohydrate binding family 9 domain-containing protein n=1 Tax=Flavobacterium sp. ZB4R12 TaxID=3398732 RepID=UPI003AAD8078
MKPNHLLIITFLIFIFHNQLSAQQSKRSIFVKYSTEKINLDGVLDEPVWQSTDLASDFWQFFPTDSLKSNNKTEVRMTYNETTLYIGIRAESKDGKFIVNSLRRDFSGSTNDNVSLIFDTFNDATNAFMFSVNPYGVQRESLVSGGGSSSTDALNSTWDIKWQSEGKTYENYYVLEIAIPFSSLKFKEGGQTWRFQAYRWDLQTNEQSAWSRVPQNQLLVNLAFLGEMHFEKPLGKNRPPIYVIPYMNAVTSKDFSNNVTGNNFAFGADAKIAIGNGLNLDITANPDFSNVEVDNIVTNITRFELSLPEKRQFFIDNGDLFANFGNTYNDAKPFFSRRIGIVRDSLGRTIENKILGGVRLSGKIDQNWRVGLLSLQTADDPANRIGSNNNSMFALQRKLFSRSNVGVFFVNRQTFGNYDYQLANDKYNRVIGMDYNLASADNTWTGKAYLHKSFQPGDVSGNLSSQAVMIYNTRKYNIISDWVYVDKDFRADLGFIPRNDIFKSGTGFARTFYAKGGVVNKYTPRIMNLMFFKPQMDFKKTDHIIWLTQDIEFRNQSILSFGYMWNNVFLTGDFDPTRTPGATPLPGNMDYTFNQFNVSFTSKNSSMITFQSSATVGQFFNGKSYSFSGTANLRIMPKALISLVANYDRIDLPAPYSKADIILISPKFDLTFSKSLFWSTLVQYSNQKSNLGINSRLQWRFAPLSDLFLVYNDNYYTREFGPTYRSVNLKLSYWFNL